MSDILIKGMEMPKHCFNCSTKVDPDNRRCNIDGHVFEETLEKLTCRRDDACPLVPVPPHGDLIDRDALMRHKGDCYDANGHLLYAVGTGNILFAPTIVEAEEGET